MKKILPNTILLVAILLLSFDIPKGWSPGGTDLTQYEMGLDKGNGQNGTSAATIKSIPDKPKAFGTMLQSFEPDKYLRKRIKMSGYMKSPVGARLCLVTYYVVRLQPKFVYRIHQSS